MFSLKILSIQEMCLKIRLSLKVIIKLFVLLKKSCDVAKFSSHPKLSFCLNVCAEYSGRNPILSM